MRSVLMLYLIAVEQGDEPPFLEVVESIRKECRHIDQEVLELPDLRWVLTIVRSSNGKA